MTVKKLKQVLEEYPEDMMVCVTVSGYTTFRARELTRHQLTKSFSTRELSEGMCTNYDSDSQDYGKPLPAYEILVIGEL